MESFFKFKYAHMDVKTVFKNYGPLSDRILSGIPCGIIQLVKKASATRTYMISVAGITRVSLLYRTVTITINWLPDLIAESHPIMSIATNSKSLLERCSTSSSRWPKFSLRAANILAGLSNFLTVCVYDRPVTVSSLKVVRKAFAGVTSRCQIMLGVYDRWTQT